MRNIWIIFRRELKSYFDSPIGYIFLTVFWLVSISLYMWPFFQFPLADMGRYFSLLPIILCIFVPAIAMRLWAEEKRLNTFEMLQTFPMTSTQIVLGKYFASLVFYILALAGTSIIPVMLAVLGDPDGGMIFSSYIGGLLIGALFLAIGIFFSGFCKDQIVAYVVTLMALLGVFLLGTRMLDTILPFGLASILKDILGVFEHYNEFTKGVIDIIHILYFVVWTALFLFLNGFYLESRSRREARLLFTGALICCIGIGLVFNWFISSMSLGRLDMTENKIYTLSKGTENILRGLEVPVTLNVYITAKDEMPTELKDFERDIVSKLEEMKIAAGGNLRIKVIHLSAEKYLEVREARLRERIAKLTGEEKEEAEEKLAKEKTIEEKLLEKGLQPFNMVANRESSQQMMQLIFSAIGLEYKDKDEDFIPQVLPASLGKLEYEVISRIFRLTRKKEPVVALVAPRSTIPDYMMQMYAQMGMPLPPQQDPFAGLARLLGNEKLDVRRVDITKESKLPDEFDVLLLISPQNLNERQLWEINRAIAQGIPTIITAHEQEFEYKIKGRRLNVSNSKVSSGINKVLEKYGIKISDKILMSSNHMPVTMQLRQGNMTVVTPIDTPLNIMILREDMNKDNPITNRLEKLFYMWGSSLDVDQDKMSENKLKATELFSTGNRAWTEKAEAFSVNANVMEPPLRLNSYTCAMLIEGQFPDTYRGKDRPKWTPKQQRPGIPPSRSKDDEESPEPVKSKPGKVILVGSGNLFSDNFLSGFEDTRKLLINFLDYLTGGEDLIRVRTNEMINRLIDKSDISNAQRNLWKILNIGGFSIIVIAAGIVYYVLRMKARKKYMASLKG